MPWASAPEGSFNPNFRSGGDSTETRMIRIQVATWPPKDFLFAARNGSGRADLRGPCWFRPCRNLPTLWHRLQWQNHGCNRPSAEQIFSIRIGKAILPAYSTVTPETDETVTPLEPRPANSAKDVTQPLTAWSRKKRAKSRRKDWNPARAWLYCELVQERR
jgi:hypothetical protein